MRGPVAPMLAVPGRLPSGDGWVAEVKWDGVRLVTRFEAGEWAAWSRNLIDRRAAWPELDGLARSLGTADVVLDGEMVVLDDRGRPDFGSVQHRMHVTDRRVAAELAAGGLPATYMVFDLLELDGRSTTSLPLSDRRRVLERLVDPGPSWRVSPQHDDPAALMAAADAQGLEGVVAKRRDSIYQPGRRSSSWRKVKVEHVDEFVVGGWFPGEGRRRGSLGALALGQPVEDAHPERLRYVGRVGTGFDESTLARLRAVLDATRSERSPFVAGSPGPDLQPVLPSLTVEVRYGEWTREGLLRHPAFLGVVRDRSG